MEYIDSEKELINKITQCVMKQVKSNKKPSLKVTVNVSARHVHLSKRDLEKLFGKGYALTPIRELMQPGEFAAKETVMIVGPKGVLQNVRVLGPLREKSQVEISKTDGYAIGIQAPVRASGDHENTPGCILIGPMGVVQLQDGVICALRHIHMPCTLANKWDLRDNQMVKAETCSERSVIFDNVQVRVSPNYVLEMHVDTDEANASGIKSGDKVFVIS